MESLFAGLGLGWNAVLFAAGAALVVAGKADDHRAGIALAAASIDDGAARAKLEALVRITNEDAS